ELSRSAIVTPSRERGRPASVKARAALVPIGSTMSMVRSSPCSTRRPRESRQERDDRRHGADRCRRREGEAEGRQKAERQEALVEEPGRRLDADDDPGRAREKREAAGRALLSWRKSGHDLGDIGHLEYAEPETDEGERAADQRQRRRAVTARDEQESRRLGDEASNHGAARPQAVDQAPRTGRPAPPPRRGRQTAEA